MNKSSSHFNRGVLTGILSMGALNGLGLIMLPHIIEVSTGIRVFAATNVIVCVVWGGLCLRKERRSEQALEVADQKPV